MRKDEILNLYPSIQKLKKELNWKPKVNIKTGLKNHFFLCKKITQLK